MIVVYQDLLQFPFGVEYFAADGGEGDHAVVAEGLEGARGDVQVLHDLLTFQVAFVGNGRLVSLAHGHHAFVGSADVSDKFLELGGLFRKQVFHSYLRYNSPNSSKLLPVAIRAGLPFCNHSAMSDSLK